MSDTPSPELVDRLHENLDDTLTTRLRAYYTSAETRAEAADRIEELTAERDAWKARADGLLAELARVLHEAEADD